MGAGTAIGNFSGAYSDLTGAPTLFSGAYSDLTGAPTLYSDSAVNTHLNQSTATSGQLLSWNGSDYDWIDAASSGVTMSDTAPSSPSAGDLWLRTTDFKLYAYYTDADSSQWVQVGPAGETGAQGPQGNDGADGSSGSSVTAYANVAALPSSGNTVGDFAFTNDKKGLYMWNGTEWDRVFAGVDETLSWTTEANAGYNLAMDGSTSTVTTAASDPDGFPITYGFSVTPSNQSQATITNNSDGTFTLTPSTNTANAGTFTLRTTATDGLFSIAKSSSISLNFAITPTWALLVNSHSLINSGAATNYFGNAQSFTLGGSATCL